MERREFIALLGGAAALMPSQVGATPAHAVPSSAGPLAGTWSFVSSINTRKDGSVVDRWGANPTGMLMFDGSGHFSQIITGSESRMFGAKTFCAFGTYTFDSVSNILTTHFVGCSNAKVIGQVQERKVVLLTAEELKYINPVTTADTMAEVLWKRLA
jgi:lipocalin-like protein